MIDRPRVSFVVPTLNRGHYVVRAVQSCLNAATEHADVEVVVLDSMSDDGSWELLVERFSDNKCVILAQNQRGLGPTRSWLDGAKRVSGQFVTFLWSDDYISPDFLEILLPPLLAGADLAVGDGAVRDIDDDSSLSAGRDRAATIDGDVFMRRHLGLVTGRALPVSPAVALFTRELFDQWVLAVENWCTQPGIRHDIMWRRAIGPDLMLFLAACLGTGRQITISERIVAQFSSHAGSITISSSTWPLRAGYWLAKWWAVQALLVQPRPIAIEALARLIVQGILLVQMARCGRSAAAVDPALIASFETTVQEARQRLFDRVGTIRGVSLLAESSLRLAWRMGSRLLG